MDVSLIIALNSQVFNLEFGKLSRDFEWKRVYEIFKHNLNIISKD